MPADSSSFSYVRTPLLAALAVAMLMAGRARETSAFQDSPRPWAEATLKAALLSRFPQFVEWPDQALMGRHEFTLCLSPSHPFGSDAAGQAEGIVLRGRPVRVRELAVREPPSDCHVLYVAPADRHLLILARGEAVLTVGDQADFCDLGGMINLRVVNGRVRFEVNHAQVIRAGLTPDTALLGLALRICGGEP